jgi:transposase
MNVEDQKGFGVSEAMESLARGKSWMLEDDDYETLQWFEKDSNPPTKEEVEEEILNLYQQAEEIKLQKAQEQKNKEVAQKSAIDKLSNLGLTEEEAKAIIGL